MTSPLPLPDWVPWWVHLVILLTALLFGLLFLLMPFSVFGVKARLEGVEARLDEIHAEIRTLALRLPENVGLDDAYVDERGRSPAQPPAGSDPQRAGPRGADLPRRGGRVEPRLY